MQTREETKPQSDNRKPDQISPIGDNVVQKGWKLFAPLHLWVFASLR
jgi:hypothetical protein